MIPGFIAALALAVITFSAGIVVGRSAAGGIRGRSRRDLPPLDDSYRHPGSQIQSEIARRPHHVP